MATTKQSRKEAQAALGSEIELHLEDGEHGAALVRGDQMILLTEGEARGWVIDPVTREPYDDEALGAAWEHFEIHAQPTDAAPAEQHRS